MNALADVVVPDLVGEIVGYRAWRVGPFDPKPRLLSIHFTAIWPPRAWLVSECGAGCSSPPAKSCNCGVYAALDRRHLVEQAYNEEDGDDLVVVLGQVGMAGKVIRCTRGYRAARARPIRLWLPYERWPLAARLAAEYRVPVSLTNPYDEEG